jgi:hypothetical protein
MTGRLENNEFTETRKKGAKLKVELFWIWSFHGGDYEEFRLLGYKIPVRTSQETLHLRYRALPVNNIVTCLTEGRRYYATLLSLLGNRNISMDTLTSPVFLRCMVTNRRNASVSIVDGNVKEGKTIHASQSTLADLRS